MAQRPADLTPHQSPAHFWGAELRTRRIEKGLSLEALGKLVYRDRSFLAKIEKGQRTITEDLARACDQAVGAGGTLIRLHALITSPAGGHVAKLGPDVAKPAGHLATTGPEPVPRFLTPPVVHEYGDDEYLTAIRRYIHSLVSLDNRFGGSDLVKVSVRFFNSLRNRLDSGAYDRRIEADLNSAAGELAEVVGWLAYDAQEHDLVRRMNQESLYFTRLAGDRSVELLTVQNASMHAGAMKRPGEALQLARSVLEGDYSLSSRLQALFLTRKARALAQMGDESSLSLFQRIKSLYLDGVADSDPAWAWWIDERELAWHEAMAQHDLGMIGLAINEFERSVEMIPQAETRSQYVHRAYLLMAQLDTGSWSDVETTVRSLIPLAAEVASARAVDLIKEVIGKISCRQAVPGRITEEVTRLSVAIDAAAL